jgi:lipopolysaccharide/colanic/teichoic acid biosynthesis glycosyltransferase
MSTPPNYPQLLEVRAAECALEVPFAPRRRVPAWRWREPFERALAAALLLLHLPIIALISVVLLLTQGAPILYRGRRLGRDRRAFTIYKFRTLRADAESRIGGRVLGEGSGLETRLGRVLRESRIDEIPQLWNILRGDMSFIGPRPVRPLVDRELSGTIPGYDLRFRIKPGLIGPVQLLVPHGASKAIRQRVHRLFYRQLRSGVSGLGPRLFALAFAAFLRCTASMTARGGQNLLLRARGGERRQHRRHRPGACELLVSDGPRERSLGGVCDISAHALTLRGSDGIPAEIRSFRLRVRFQRRGRSRTRVIRCAATSVHDRRSKQGPQRQVISYRPLSDHAEYLRDKYLLDRSLI